MVSSPVQNLNDFLKNRSPLVVFLLCLVALAISTFYFAFVIKQDDQIADFDKEHDWTQMLKHFSNLDVCINSSTWTNEISVLENENTFKDEMTVFTTVRIDNASVPASEVFGTLSLEGWYSTTCQDPTKQPKLVDVFFDISSPTETQVNDASIEVCVTIKGPAQYLPFIRNPVCKPEKKDKKTKLAKRYLSSKLPGTYDPQFCAKGTNVRLTFDSTVVKIENYLSDDVRIQIYDHLVWCSYFLVFIIFGILLFSILKKSDYLDKKEQSARLL